MCVTVDFLYCTCYVTALLTWPSSGITLTPLIKSVNMRLELPLICPNSSYVTETSEPKEVTQCGFTP